MLTQTANAELALNAILRKPSEGIPTAWLNIMEHAALERLAGVPPGAYPRDPEQTYIKMQQAVGVCVLDQFIPRNPLSMGSRGFVGAARGATTGAESVVLDGIPIDSPEAVADHLEHHAFPALRDAQRTFREDEAVDRILKAERTVQEQLGPDILKTGYAFVGFPHLAYGTYGYANYFMAYALYPEIIEQHFRLQADLAVLRNRAAARAYREGGLPPIYRLDHDMADSRGTLVDVRSLDRLWFPHFARSIEPLLRADVRLIWHCDGNLMAMLPRLLETGLRGFQGFQYEDGMEYVKICRMKARDGQGLLIWAGVSVTQTLPFGRPADVRKELNWLVENGPRTGLLLGASSSITPGVPWENLEALVAGLRYYRNGGR